MEAHGPRVLIADDHLLVAELCKKLLEGEFNVVGIVGNGRELVEAAVTLKPHVAIVDIAMPVLNGIDAGRQVKQLLPSIKLLYLTMTHDEELAAELICQGASGYLLKTCTSSELVAAVRDVLRGKHYLSSELSKEHLDTCRWEGQSHRDNRELTERQREVLQLLAEGRLMKEVGSILNITSRTVAFHKYKAMEALGINTNADIVKYAVRERLVA